MSVYIDELAFGDGGEVTHFTWADIIEPRPWWQRMLAPVVPAWRGDRTFRITTIEELYEHGVVTRVRL